MIACVYSLLPHVQKVGVYGIHSDSLLVKDKCHYEIYGDQFFSSLIKFINSISNISIFK